MIVKHKSKGYGRVVMVEGVETLVRWADGGESWVKSSALRAA